jgi:hypothetical protein
MKMTTTHCDRCGSNIIERGWTLEVKAGSIRTRFPEPLDLCSDCGSLFGDWLRSGKPHHTHQDAAGEALSDTAVASMELVGGSARGDLGGPPSRARSRSRSANARLALLKAAADNCNCHFGCP